ncbi:MAG: DUF1573 domain-containing protein [Planctomycetota bacterium]|nr:MAG: DUF1573 domain-containing protein [Planctomycetota bacterium]
MLIFSPTPSCSEIPIMTIANPFPAIPSCALAQPGRRGGIMVVAVAATVILGIFLALAAAMASGTRYRIPEAGSEMRVLFSGESLGRILPNMCEGYPAGGLEFRAGFLAQQRRPFLLLDTGCLTTPGPDAALWAEEILRQLGEMVYDAVNLGEHEANLGAAELARLAKVGPPLVNANVRRLADDQPVAQPFIVSRRGGYRSAITGLVDEALVRAPDLRAESPHEALARLLPAMREAAEVLVVLADLDREQADALARDFPELHLILHRSRNNTRLPESVNRAVVGAIYGDRYIADTTLTWEGQRRLSARTEATELTSQSAGAAPIQNIPEGLRVSPERIDFGPIADGEQRQAQLTIHNDSSGLVRLSRVLSTCGCFVLGIEEQDIAAGAQLEITVTLHAVALEASNNVSLYLQLEGAVEGMLMVPATAQIIANAEEAAL